MAQTLMALYHGYFELLLESLTNSPIAADIIVFGIISGNFLFILIMVCCAFSLELPHCMLFVLIRIASMRIHNIPSC